MSATVKAATDAAIAEAKDLPHLIAQLETADPCLAQAIKGKSLIASRTPWGTVAVGIAAWAAAKLGLGWDADTCAFVGGLGVLAGSYLMRRLTRGQITGLVMLPLVVLLAACGTDRQAMLTVLCRGDAVAQPVAVRVLPLLAPSTATAVQLDDVLVHPEVIAACKAVGGLPAAVASPAN